MSDDDDDEAGAYAHRIAEQMRPVFGRLRSILDLLLLGLAVTWLLGVTSWLPLALVGLARLLLPAAFGWIAGRRFSQRNRRGGA